MPALNSLTAKNQGAGGETQGMTMTDDRERKAAEAKFKKSERATEGAKAMADYNAEGEAERAKTVRLKAQRLGKAPIQEYARTRARS